jgi:hypothetical protein
MLSGHHLGQVIEDALVETVHDGQSMRRGQVDAGFPLGRAAFVAAYA